MFKSLLDRGLAPMAQTNYCDCLMSLMHHTLCVVNNCFKARLSYTGWILTNLIESASNYTGWILTNFDRNDPYMTVNVVRSAVVQLVERWIEWLLVRVSPPAEAFFRLPNTGSTQEDPSRHHMTEKLLTGM